ncbi:MAG: ammonia-forming cytochrome c nitrite reductase subunit c552, partial [Actinomycetia bacterium]|nr:ammonia-forming cytochrome c nitrite reductase subunit c552 [Actinomycetes bacterium]
MKKRLTVTLTLSSLVIFILLSLFASGCAPPKTEPVKTGVIAKEEYDPAKWGQLYPLEYDTYRQTKEPSPAEKSKYKKGWDTDKVIYDKLSEYPFLALLYNGWGFGVEYNEPRGHYYMMIDQLEIDKSRIGAGGVCLTCKTPYMNKLVEENGKEFFKMPYEDALKKIPQEHRTLGAACIDCHDNETMSLKVDRFVLEEGLKALGKSNLTRQEMRSIVCAQCHVTYFVTKDSEMKSTGVVFPWEGSEWEDISIENIIVQLQSDPANLEWKQSVTGFKLAFIRHPEFEFFSRNSVHWNAGVACADCHMPYVRVGANKISDHNIMSPLKNDLKACIVCHPESPEDLKKQVIAIQDRTVSLINRAGYQTAVAAKLFELTHSEQDKGKTIDEELYEQAKSYYLEAFYRLLFLGAENSVGFHNPSEAGRISGDAIAFASKSESLLRQALVQAGVEVPIVINLELSKYLNQRGSKKLDFKPEQEIKDPFDIQDMLLPEEAKGL